MTIHSFEIAHQSKAHTIVKCLHLYLSILHPPPPSTSRRGRTKLMKIEIRKIIFHLLLFSSLPTTAAAAHFAIQISIRFRRFILSFLCVCVYVCHFLMVYGVVYRKICCFNKMLINVADLNLTGFEFSFIFIFFLFGEI